MNYHVRRKERELTDVNELHAILERGRYAVVGLSRNDEPYVVSLSYGHDAAANALYFHCAKTGQKIDFIRANPRACATVVDTAGEDSDSCDHPYVSVVLRGAIRIVEDREEIDRALRLMIRHQEKKRIDYFLGKLTPGNKGYDNVLVLKMTVEEMSGKARD
jgi:nitroimidazol reductase NimA-like FMN-containing flavoprotein (pyridoxamine 5'-phosphate oxidase superfamily)